jgi:tetratricopeptide (TPR) repeat protein
MSENQNTTEMSLRMQALHAQMVDRDVDLALSLYERIIALDPSDFSAWFSKGAILLGKERYQEALLSLKTAIELKPTAIVYWIYAGHAEARSNNPGAALRIYEKALDLCRDKKVTAEPINGLAETQMSEILSSIAECYEKNNEIDKARDWHKKATEYNPNSWQAWLDRGLFAINHDRPHIVRDCFTRILELAESDEMLANNTMIMVWAYGCIGHSYRNERKYEVALKWFEKATKTSLTPENLFYEGLVLYELKRFQEARDHLAPAGALDPKGRYAKQSYRLCRRAAWRMTLRGEKIHDMRFD